MKRKTAKLRRIFCAVFRHSVILENCIGYQHCGRCGEQLGDTLAGAYEVECGLNCGCQQCQDTYATLGVMDKWLVSKPEWLGWTPEAWKAHQRAERERFMAAIQTESQRMRERIARAST